jgi:hypothetical protein
MTQEQEIIVEEYMAKNDNGQESMNAMWLGEEMWEQHCAIMRAKMSGSGSKYVIEKRTWMMNFCMSLMEYIWLPHDVIKDIALNSNQPERFEYSYNSFEGNWRVKAIDITCNDEGHDREVYCVITRHAEEMPMMALALILNEAKTKADDAVKRLSA